MATIGLFYGTQTGKTETAAERIQQEFGGASVVTFCNEGRIQQWVTQLKQEFGI